MNKERLEEIETKYSTLTVSSERDGIEYIEVNVEDLVFLIQNGFKQVERISKQETRINNLTLDLAVSRMQNKCYREAIEKALDESGWGDEGYALNKIMGILTKALKDLR